MHTYIHGSCIHVPTIVRTNERNTESFLTTRMFRDGPKCFGCLHIIVFPYLAAFNRKGHIRLITTPGASRYWVVTLLGRVRKKAGTRAKGWPLYSQVTYCICIVHLGSCAENQSRVRRRDERWKRRDCYAAFGRVCLQSVSACQGPKAKEKQHTRLAFVTHLFLPSCMSAVQKDVQN